VTFGFGCVVFDIDDTVYLERDYVASGFAAVDAWLRQECGVAGFRDVATAEFERGVRRVIFDRALATLGVEANAALIEAMVRAYREHVPQITLLSDARGALDVLAGRCRLAVVSDGPVASQHGKAFALGLSTWCSPIVLTGSFGAGYDKPHPRGFEVVEDETGVRAERCVYVADNPAKDFEGPKSLGWRTVRVRRDGGLHASLPSGPDVDLEFPDLLALPAGLENLT
jgi:putative hydrolase of the HAD superfamily